MADKADNPPEHQSPTATATATTTAVATIDMAPPATKSSDRSSDDAVVQDTIQTATNGMPASAPRASIMVARMKGQPLTNAAIFSTDDGRTPARPPPGPPYPPVIAKSNPILGAVLYANEWRNKCPQYYHRFFPDKPWSITDLWDKAEIHLQDAEFLTEVLGFITKDNMFRANHYANEWWRHYPEKFEMLGGDLHGIWDPSQPLSIVDKFFTHGEQNEYPTEFLWHVLHFLRAFKIGTLEDVVWTPTEALHNVPMMEQQNVMQEMSMVRQQFAHGPPPTGPSNPGAVVALPHAGMHGPPGRMPTYGNGQQPAGPPFAGRVPAPPTNGAGPLRNPKNRFHRSDSVSSVGMYNQPQQNGNMRTPSGGHSRQHSGHGIHGQGPRNPSNMSAGPNFINNMNHMPQFNQASPMVSPRMRVNQMAAPNMHLPGQMAFPPMMQHELMMPPPPGFVPHPMDPAFPPHGINMHGPRGMPFGDMTNAMHYPPGMPMDNRGIMERRDSVGRHPSDRLYNPYGSERPDKAANFNQIPIHKKAHRNSSGANSQNRPRKQSVNSRHGSSAFDRDEGQWSGSARLTERPTFGAPIDSVVNDMERGCDARRIGPKNETVRKLYVTNLPEKVTESELFAVFQTKAEVARVELKQGAGMEFFTHAFVYFNSPTQARICLLDAYHIEVRGKILNVSVPHFYWKVMETNLPRGPPPTGPSAHGRHRSSAYDRADSGAGLGKPLNGPQYSPQDARSDLARRARCQPDDYPAAHGSPEARKARMHTQSEYGHAQVENKVEVSAKVPVAVAAAVAPAVTADVPTAVPAAVPAAVPEQPAVVESTKNSVVAESLPLFKEKIVSVDQDAAAAVADAPIQEPSSQEVPPQEVPSQEVPSQDIPPQEPLPQELPSQEILSPERTSQELPSEETPSQEAIAKSTSPLPPIIEVPAPVAEVANVVPEPLTSALIEVVTAPSTQEPATDRDAPLSPKPLAHQPSGAVTADSDKVEDARVDDKQAENGAISVEKTPKGSRLQDEAENDLSFHSAQEALEESATVAIDTSPQPDIGSTQEPEGSNNLSNSNIVQPTVDAGKKSGAQQTQSLFPFAKPSKAQKQKEKQAKRKDKKKEKTKTDKTGSTPTKPGKSSVIVKDEVSQSTQSDDKIEAPARDSQIVEIIQQAAVKPDDHKQAQQKLRLGSTAPDSAVFDEAAVPQPKLEHPSPSAPNSKLKACEEEAPKKKSHHLTQIAVPKFGQILKTPSSSAVRVSGSTTAGPLGMTSPTGVNRASGKPASDQLPADITTLKETLDLQNVPDTAKTAFFTPMPTPTADMPSPIMDTPTPSAPTTAPPAIMPAEQLKATDTTEPNPPTPEASKKKKKKKSNKKKNKGVSSGDVPVVAAKSQDSSDEDPFASQLKEIANLESKQGEEKPDAKHSSNPLQSWQVSKYLKEKKEAYANLPLEGWSGSKEDVMHRLIKVKEPRIQSVLSDEEQDDDHPIVGEYTRRSGREGKGRERSGIF